MKKVLSLILAVLMISSVMVFSTFAEESADGYALNNLGDFGQRTVDATTSMTPKMDGTVNPEEYAGAFDLYQVNNASYKDIGPYKLYVAQDANKIYFGLTFDEAVRRANDVPAGSGGTVGNWNGMALYINFPTEFSSRDANNYLVIYMNMISNAQWPLVAVKAIGDDAFVARMQTKLNEYGVKGEAEAKKAMPSQEIGNIIYPDVANTGTFPYTYKYNGFIPIGRLLKYSGVMPDTPKGAVTVGKDGSTNTVANYEFSLSKAAMMDIFGWDGKTDMTVMAWAKNRNVGWGTQIADEGTSSKTGEYRRTYGSAAGAKALEEYSKEKFEYDIKVAPWVTAANKADGSVSNGMFADARNLPAIPDVVKLWTETPDPVENTLLNDLSKYGQFIYDAKEYTDVTVDGAITEGEYANKKSDFYYKGTTGPFDTYAAQDEDNIYLATYVDEAKRNNAACVPTETTNFSLGSGVRFFINFPSEFTAKDANNYLIIHMQYSTTETPIIALSCVGDEAFVALMQEKFGDALSPNSVSDPRLPEGEQNYLVNLGDGIYETGLVADCATVAVERAITYEIALNKEAIKDIFGWNGFSEMTYMPFIKYGNKWAATMSHYMKNENAATALEEYSALLGDTTPVAPEVYECYDLKAMDDVIPSVVDLSDVEFIDGEEGPAIPDTDILAPDHIHEFGEEWETGSLNHWHECECGEMIDKAAHEFDEGVVDGDKKVYTCEVCGYEKKEAYHAHDFTGEWKSDADKHWHECECGEKADEAAHAFDEGTVTKEPTVEEKGEKKYVCACGYEKVEELAKLDPPATTPAPTTPAPTTPAPAEEGGCGSAMALAALAVVPALAVAFTAKKKED